MKLPRFLAAVVGCSLAFQAFALSQNDAAQPKRVHIHLKEAAELRKHYVEAEYLESSQAEHVWGNVFLRIVIDREGKVIEAAPVSRDEWAPLNFTEDPRLRDAAIQAVKQWEYKPYVLDGQPVEVETRVVVLVKPRVIDSSGDVRLGSGGPIGGVAGGSRGGVIGGIIGSAAPPPKVAAPPKQRVSSEVLEGNLLTHEAPVYPPLARQAKIQGMVRLQATISKTGAVENLRAFSGHPLLIQPAMDAVRQWKYKPFLLDGDPVEVEGDVFVVFKL